MKTLSSKALPSFALLAFVWLGALCPAYASEPKPPSTGKNGEVIWSIGQPDGYGIEFAPGTRGQLTFTVGRSVVSKDFAGHQGGSVGFDGQTNEQPYSIVF